MECGDAGIEEGVFFCEERRRDLGRRLAVSGEEVNTCLRRNRYEREKVERYMLPMSFLAARQLANGCEYEGEAEEGIEGDISAEDEEEALGVVLALCSYRFW